MKAAINKLGECVGQEVELSGWVYHSRQGGKVQFIVIRDGTGVCQCIAERGKISDGVYDELAHLGLESSLKINGIVRSEPRSPGHKHQR